MDTNAKLATVAGVAAVLIGLVTAVFPEPRLTNSWFWFYSVMAIFVSSLAFLIPTKSTTESRKSAFAGDWTSFGANHFDPNAAPDGTLKVRQNGNKLEAEMTLLRTRRGRAITRIYKYRGEVSNLQVIFRFHQQEEEGIIIGAVVLAYEPAIRAMIGKSVYYDFREKSVVAEDCAFYRDIQTKRAGDA
jgi:hypothetical protein